WIEDERDPGWRPLTMEIDAFMDAADEVEVADAMAAIRQAGKVRKPTAQLWSNFLYDIGGLPLAHRPFPAKKLDDPEWSFVWSELVLRALKREPFALFMLAATRVQTLEELHAFQDDIRPPFKTEDALAVKHPWYTAYLLSVMLTGEVRAASYNALWQKLSELEQPSQMLEVELAWLELWYGVPGRKASRSLLIFEYFDDTSALARGLRHCFATSHLFPWLEPEPSAGTGSRYPMLKVALIEDCMDFLGERGLGRPLA
ncbi:MAG: hypothetical protein VX005_07140, partial [Pseudomonadota bacterium]|nr:hypothetical protein [Pseudomonadota bacterium]